MEQSGGKIFHMAGATTPQQQTIAALEHAIREAGPRACPARQSLPAYFAPVEWDNTPRQRLQSLRARSISYHSERNRRIVATPTLMITGGSSTVYVEIRPLGCVKYLNARPLIRGWPAS